MSYIIKTFRGEMKFEEQEQLVTHLLTPDLTCVNGRIEQLEEELDHMKGCLSRFMIQREITTDDYSLVFNANVTVNEDS